jgi:carbon storage regulator CsrA
MLVVTRKTNTKILLEDHIEIMLVAIRIGNVKLGIEALDLGILCQELRQRRPACTAPPFKDCSNDYKVDLTDFAEFLTEWLT